MNTAKVSANFAEKECKRLDPGYDLTNDETEDNDEEWIDKGNESDKGNVAIVKSKTCRKKRKLKSAKGVTMIKHNATTKKIYFIINNRLQSRKTVATIEGTNNDDSVVTAQKISPDTTFQCDWKIRNVARPKRNVKVLRIIPLVDPETNDKSTSDGVPSEVKAKVDDAKLKIVQVKVSSSDIDTKRCRRSYKKLKLVVAKDAIAINDAHSVNNIATTSNGSLNSTNKMETITFNVGGKRYVVSLSLINSFPDTMLARASSNILTVDGKKMIDPIFIERDGDRFRLILDYMRDKKVTVPCSISREALLHDFQYFGFDVDPQNIRMDFHIPDVADLVAHVKDRARTLMKKTGSERLQMIQKSARVERETYDEQQTTIALANTERDRLVNSANLKANKIISDLLEQKKVFDEEYNLERKYIRLVDTCFVTYLTTNKLQWKLTCPKVIREQYELYGCYVSHRKRSDFVNETKPINDDLIMKRVANLFGLSHVYAYYKAGTLSDSEKKSDDVDLEYEFKIGMLPRTINLETIVE